MLGSEVALAARMLHVSGMSVTCQLHVSYVSCVGRCSVVPRGH